MLAPATSSPQEWRVTFPDGTPPLLPVLQEKDKRLDAVEKELRQLQADKAAWAKQQKALESQVAGMGGQ